VKLPSWMPDLKSAGQWFISAVIGGAVVALMNQYFATQLEQDKTLLQLRRSAYQDFFKGQGILQRLRSEPDLSEAEKIALGKEQSVLIRNALFDIAVYSAKPTAAALAAYYKKYLTYGTCPDLRERWVADIETYKQMRRELFGGFFWHNLDDETMVLLVHNCLMPKQ
jgi:hypothetical protein